jgi:flagellar hook assembly protein FlgD
VVQRLQFRNLSAGANTIVWDGKVSDGRYAAPGTYRLGVSGYLSNGNRSMVSYVLQQVYY